MISDTHLKNYQNACFDVPIVYYSFELYCYLDTQIDRYGLFEQNGEPDDTKKLYINAMLIYLQGYSYKFFRRLFYNGTTIWLKQYPYQKNSISYWSDEEITHSFYFFLMPYQKRFVETIVFECALQTTEQLRDLVQEIVGYPRSSLSIEEIMRYFRTHNPLNLHYNRLTKTFTTNHTQDDIDIYNKTYDVNNQQLLDKIAIMRYNKKNIHHFVRGSIIDSLDDFMALTALIAYYVNKEARAPHSTKQYKQCVRVQPIKCMKILLYCLQGYSLVFLRQPFISPSLYSNLDAV